MRTTAIERLRLFIKHLEIPVSKFEKTCGLSNGYIKGVVDKPSNEKLETILEKYPDLNKDYILYGEEPMLKSEINQMVQINENYSAKGQPYYNVDFMGGFDLMTNDQTTVPAGYVNLPAINDSDVLWVNVTGHSMEPAINHGDIIAIKELQDWRTYLPKGEIYGIVTKNELRTVKIVRKGSDDQHIKLVPVNISEYDEEEIPLSSIMKVFVVLANIKRF